MTRKTCGLAFVAVVFLYGQALAYTVSMTPPPDSKEIKCSVPGASFYFNEGGAPSGALAAMQAAFQTWTDVSTSSFVFTYAGSTTNTGYGNFDNVNIIGFKSGLSSGTLALSTVYYDVSTGEVLDNDIQFNTAVTWSTTGSPTAYDVQSVGVHELGHSLSLEDLYALADAEKTMYGIIPTGETKKRTLDQDDIDGISYLYPVYANAIGLVGDFDGDDRTDLTEYNVDDGYWYIKYSGTLPPLLGFPMGWSEAVPVPGDYDGDKKTDMAVYHQAAGQWYIRYSSTGEYLLGFPMGWSEAVPVPGDYDGDGTTDMAVYYQAAGAWYVAYSSGGYLLGDTIGWR